MRLTLPTALPWISVLALAVAAAACGGASEEHTAASRAEIEQTLEEYLPLLAEAYATGDLEVLRPYTVEKELAILQKVIGQQAKAGRVFAPELNEMALEDVTVWQHVNAYASTVERWHVKVYAAGSESLLSEDPDQVSRVRYQLKKEDGRWRVFSRQRLDAEGEES